MEDRPTLAGPEPPPWAAQLPLIGVVLLLVLMILVTPALIGRSGAPQTVAVLVIDRAPNANETHFYIQGVAPVRYQYIDVGIATGFAWPPSGRLGWAFWVNQTESLSVSAVSAGDPVAVNVTAEFVDSSGVPAYYFGVYAFNVTSGAIDLAALTPGLSPGTSSLPIADLPETLPLVLSPTGPP